VKKLVDTSPAGTANVDSLASLVQDVSDQVKRDEENWMFCRRRAGSQASNGERNDAAKNFMSALHVKAAFGSTEHKQLGDGTGGIICSEPSADRLLCKTWAIVGDYEDAGHDAAMAATVQPVPQPSVREATNL
jgi:hypothetical protein